MAKKTTSAASVSTREAHKILGTVLMRISSGGAENGHCTSPILGHGKQPLRSVSYRGQIYNAVVYLRGLGMALNFILEITYLPFSPPKPSYDSLKCPYPSYTVVNPCGKLTH